MLSPSGEHLSNCDRKKVEWYLKNDLAELVSEEPTVIKLKFAPSGFGKNNEVVLYAAQRDNICVICGSQSELLKYHVVPKMYRRFFAVEKKSHQSHDILLLCLRCHEKAGTESDKFKQALAQKFNVEYIQYTDSKKAIDLLKLLSNSAHSYAT